MHCVAQDFSSVCLGHLFTYRDFKGTIGLAWVADPSEWSVCAALAVSIVMMVQLEDMLVEFVSLDQVIQMD